MQKVEIYTERGLMLELPLRGSDDGYIVQNITGLDPVKADVVSSPFALLDGEEYQTSRGGKRDILLELGYALDHASSIGARRQKLYTYFMPKAKITLRFYWDGVPVVDIEGVVESFDAPQFVEDPEAKAVILCHRPEFISTVLTTFTGGTTSTPLSETISYPGTIDTGFVFTMTVPRAMNGFTMNHNVANGAGSTLEFAMPLVAGDIVEINTNAREKGAYLTRAGVRRSVLYAVSPSSTYIELYEGENTFRVYADGAPIPYKLEYREKFGGL